MKTDELGQERLEEHQRKRRRENPDGGHGRGAPQEGESRQEPGGEGGDLAADAASGAPGQTSVPTSSGAASGSEQPAAAGEQSKRRMEEDETRYVRRRPGRGQGTKRSGEGLPDRDSLEANAEAATEDRAQRGDVEDDIELPTVLGGDRAEEHQAVGAIDNFKTERGRWRNRCIETLVPYC